MWRTPGDAVSDAKLRRPQIYIEGDQGKTGTSDQRAGSGIEDCWPLVRRPLRLCQLARKRLILALANVGQALALGPGCSILVVVDRHPKLANETPETPADLDCLCGLNAAHRDERRDINCPLSRVAAVMPAHIDKLEGLHGQPLRRFEYILRFAKIGKDGTIVVRVAGVIDQPHARNGPHLGSHLLNDRHVAPLADVRLTQQYLAHGLSFLGRVTQALAPMRGLVSRRQRPHP